MLIPREVSAPTNRPLLENRQSLLLGRLANDQFELVCSYLTFTEDIQQLKHSCWVLQQKNYYTFSGHVQPHNKNLITMRWNDIEIESGFRMDGVFHGEVKQTLEQNWHKYCVRDYVRGIGQPFLYHFHGTESTTPCYIQYEDNSKRLKYDVTIEPETGMLKSVYVYPSWSPSAFRISFRQVSSNAYRLLMRHDERPYMLSEMDVKNCCTESYWDWSQTYDKKGHPTYFEVNNHEFVEDENGAYKLKDERTRKRKRECFQDQRDRPLRDWLPQWIIDLLHQPFVRRFNLIDLEP
jgi:hypothetical protein